MPINPIRTITRTGVVQLLSAAISDVQFGQSADQFAILFTDASIDPTTGEAAGIVQPTDGWQVSRNAFPWLGPLPGEDGRRMVLSGPLTFIGSAFTGTQTIRGVALSKSDEPLDVVAIMEFDEPFQVSEAGQRLEMKIEMGIHEGELYIRPRVLPAGQ